MMTLGSRTYSLVRAQCGLRVSLSVNPRYPHERQSWTVEAHYVPDDDDAGPGPGEAWEYWRMGIQPLGFYTTTDWRELVGLSRDDERLDPLLGSAENLLARWHGREDVRGIHTGEFRVLRREGFLFTCEWDGEFGAQTVREGEEPGAGALEFTLRDELPLREVRVEVPVNAADPLSAAKAIAARELGLTQWGRSHVELYDPARKVWKPQYSGKHTVLLEVAGEGER